MLVPMGRRMIMAVAFLMLLAGIAEAGQYKLKPATQSPVFKNPSGGTIQYTNVTTTYTGGSGSWGASRQYDFSFVDAQGTITTVWEWVPDKIPGTQTDDSLDTPPEWVIVHEQSEASYSGWCFLSGMWIGACDNDLGFEVAETVEEMYTQGEEPGLSGYTFSGIAKGTRYKKRAGGAEISVTCNPFAAVAVVDGMCSAKVNYGVQIINPKIEVVGVTDFTTPARAIKFITGQNIGATVSLQRSTGNQLYEEQHLGILQNSHRWTIPEWDSFKNYVYGEYLGKKYELAATDKEQAMLEFYSNKNGSGKLSCAFKVTEPAGAILEVDLPDLTAKSRTIESVRPDPDGWDVATGSIFLSGGYLCMGPGGGSAEGQQWTNVGISIPGGFPQQGTGGFCQLITADRRLYRTLTTQGVQAGAYTDFIKNPHNGLEGLDDGYPYPPPHGGTWSLPNKGTGHDSPSQPLSWSPGDNYTLQWYKSTATDSFKTWAMFRPPSQGSRATTWIPIQSYIWTWSAVAELQGSWTITSQTVPTPSQPDEDFDHPEWTRFSPSPFGFIGAS